MTQIHCDEYARLSRASFFTPIMPAWRPRIALADPHVGPRGDTLVCIFLRGGADGLNIIVPHGDEQYYAQRPTISIARPDQLSAGYNALDLDGFFGLHPSLTNLHAIYQGGDMAFVQATGSPDETRSHFEAQDLMERGAVPGEHSGWLARHLATLDTGNESALRAIGIGDMLPVALAGALTATALPSLQEYQVTGDSSGQLQTILYNLYNQQSDPLTTTANQTFDALNVIEQVASHDYVAKGRGYQDGQAFHMALRTTAQLIKAQVGVEVACIDLDGWDTHVAQGAGEGIMARNLQTLGDGLAAFYEDMLDYMGNLTVVVMSEFGRRVRENSGLGTDHGHGNMMMVMGGGVNGRQVLSRWPGLHPEQLVGPGDLAITTDYRDILAEIILKRLKNPNLSHIFPNHTPAERGLLLA